MSIKYRLDDAASLKAGTIYFMRERDVLTARMSPYVKVGLIESSPYHDVRRRLADLQTGNPNVLSVEATVETNLVYWVESLMHRKLAPERVNGEWFLLEENRIRSAVGECETLASNANNYFPVVYGAVPLKNITSNGNIIAASSEAIEWDGRHRRAKCQLDLCRELELLFKTIFESLENRDEMRHVGKIQIIATRRFDLPKFILEYPDLWSRFCAETVVVKGRFIFEKTPPLLIDVVNPGLELFAQDFRSAASCVEANGDGMERLREMYMALVSKCAAFAEAEDLARANLRMLCGEADGIKGVCNWVRKEVRVKKLNEQALKMEFPKEHSEFASIYESSRTTLSRFGQDRGRVFC